MVATQRSRHAARNTTGMLFLTGTPNTADTLAAGRVPAASTTTDRAEAGALRLVGTGPLPLGDTLPRGIMTARVLARSQARSEARLAGGGAAIQTEGKPHARAQPADTPGPAFTPAEHQAVADARAAHRLTPTDARWLLAVRTARALHATKGAPHAAVLPPELRDELMAAARELRLRPFDAALIIAIVQDSARAGLGALGPATAGRLEHIAPVPPRPRDRTAVLMQAASAVLLAAVLLLGVVLLLRA